MKATPTLAADRPVGAVLWCGGCGAGFVRHRRASACPACGGAEVASSWIGPVARLLGPGLRPGLRLAGLLLAPPVVAVDELVRCATCERTTFGQAATPCPACEGEEVGLDLALAAADERPGARFAGLARLVRLGHLLVLAPLWGLVLLDLIVAEANYPLPRVIISASIDVLVALSIQTALALALRAALWRQTPATGVTTGDRAALEATVRRLVLPFLERHHVPPHGSIRRAAPELELLGKALITEGVHVAPARVRPLVIATALERDLADLERRLAAEAARTPGRTLVRRYAQLVRAEDDATWLALLQELAATTGEAPPDLELHVAAAREAIRVEGFKEALEAQRAAPGIRVSLEMIDAMDPTSFEGLVALLYEVEGHHATTVGRAGDQGADVILERGGRRTAVQTKRYSAPVGNAAVQEVIAAKAFHRCDHGVVVTNATFTRAAVELAASAAIELVDRATLDVMLGRLNREPVHVPRLTELFGAREPPSPAPAAAPTTAPIDAAPPPGSSRAGA